MTDERLRELYERTLASRGADATRAGCPTPEALHALVRREGTEAERLATLDHVMSCAACARDFELLRAVEAAGVATAGAAAVAAPAGVGRTHQAIPWRQIAPFALAASLLLAVGVVGVRGRRGGGADVAVPGDVMRGGSGEGALTLIAPAAAAAVDPTAPLTFVWRADPDARRYVLEVLDAGGRAVVSADARDTTLTLRDATALRPGVGYRWLVRSFGDGGAQRASAARPLRVKAPGT